MFRTKKLKDQQSIWLETDQIVSTPATSFYDRLDRELEKFGFGEAVRQLCEPYYTMDSSVGGRPGTDPEVYFKMLMIGMFENISSGRGIASRCADSLSIRRFLHYELTERTPDHRTLSVITKRLDEQVHREVFDLILRALKQAGLVRGKHVAIDSSDIEANASLRSLRHRLSRQSYIAYVRRLAEEAGIDPADDEAVRRFDRTRPGRKTSNEDWENPHDPEAKVGRTKRGTTRMMYKPEHTVDIQTGVILDAEVRPGDEHDSHELAERISGIEARVNVALDYDDAEATFETLTADKGYFKVAEIVALQTDGIRTNISDPQRRRKDSRQSHEQRRALARARRMTGSDRGKELLRRRAERLERTFVHVLDQGGGRKATVRGRGNIRKRYLLRAAAFNLTLLMRRLTGVGTPKQAIAQGLIGVFRLVCTLLRRLELSMNTIGAIVLSGAHQVQSTLSRFNRPLSTGSTLNRW